MSFAETAERIFERGYRIVPIPPKGFRYGKNKEACGKRPIEKNWQRFADEQTRETVRRLAGKSPNWGVGILTGKVVGVDVDVYDEAASAEIVSLAQRVLGAGLVRIGRAPKTLLVYRTEAPFSKINSRTFPRPGEEQGHKIEILAKGQQFVGFAIHPDTGEPYRWVGPSPLEVPAADLPVITEAMAQGFRDEAEAVLLRHGFLPVRLRPSGVGNGHAAVNDPDLPPEAPPCLHTLAASRSFGDWQNNGVFNLAVLRKRSDPTDGYAWEAAVQADNKRYFDPPLDDKALASVIKSVRGKPYFYQCKEQPICAVCDKEVCRTRRFGIGPDYDPDGGRFQVIAGKLTYIKEDGRVELANFAARIVEDQVVDDGAETTMRYRIEGALDDGAALPAIIVPAEKFAGSGWVGPRWGSNPIVHAGAGTAMLCEAIQTVSGRVPIRRVYAHLGWREVDGRWLYLHAGGAIGAGGPVDGVAVEVDGELKRFQLPAVRDVRAAVRASLELLDLNTLTAAAVWRAPLLEWYPLPVSPFKVGPTGSLKSAIDGVAQAHWGAGFDGIQFAANWSSTANKLEKDTFVAKDCLLVIDDFSPTGNQHDVRAHHTKAETIFRGVANRGGRGRMRSDTTSRVTYYARGLVMASGEDVPAGHSLRSRLLIEQFSRTTIEQTRLTRLQEAARDGRLAEAMAGYVMWIAGAVEDGRIGNLNDMPTPEGVEHRRTAAGANAMLLGVQMFLAFAVEVGAIDDMERRYAMAYSNLHRLALAQNEEQQEEDPAVVFIEAIPALLASGRAHISEKDGTVPGAAQALLGWSHRATHYYESPDGQTSVAGDDWQSQGNRIGVLDGAKLYLFPKVVTAAVQRMLGEQGANITIKSATLGKRLDQKGLIIDKEEGRLAKLVNIKGRRERVWVMSTDVIGLSNQSNQSGEVGE